MSGSFGKLAEDRLAGLTGGKRQAHDRADSPAGSWLRPAAIDLGGPSFWAKLVPNAENLNLLYEQADVSFSFNTLHGSRRWAGRRGRGRSGYCFQLPYLVVPLGAIVLAAAPVPLADAAGRRIESSSSSPRCRKPSS